MFKFLSLQSLNNAKVKVAFLKNRNFKYRKRVKRTNTCKEFRIVSDYHIENTGEGFAIIIITAKMEQFLFPHRPY